VGLHGSRESQPILRSARKTTAPCSAPSGSPNDRQRLRTPAPSSALWPTESVDETSLAERDAAQRSRSRCRSFGRPPVALRAAAPSPDDRRSACDSVLRGSPPTSPKRRIPVNRVQSELRPRSNAQVAPPGKPRRSSATPTRARRLRRPTPSSARGRAPARSRARAPARRSCVPGTPRARADRPRGRAAGPHAGCAPGG
jgi:hypothetical protein